MANETTVQISCIQENHTADECRENIPPGVTAASGTSKLKTQVGDVVGFSSTQSSGENEPLSHTSTFSTPAPGSSKAKSRLSGLQSALTPILKYLNIGNKCPSPEPLKHGNNPYLADTAANGRKASRGSNQLTNSHSPSSHTNAPVCWLDDECLPEITLLDVTCDSMMHQTKNDSALTNSMPSTPITAGSMKTTFTNLQLSQLGASVKLNTTSQIHQASSVSKSTTEASLVINQSSSAGKIAGLCDVQNGKITVSLTTSSDGHQTTMDKLSPPKVCNAKVHPPEMSRYDGTPDSKLSNSKMFDIPESIDAPLRWLDDRFFPEITLLDVTRDSEFSPRGEMSSLDVTQDIPPVSGLEKDMPPSALSGQIVAEPGTLDTIQSEDLSRTLDGNITQTTSSFSEQSDKCVAENIPKASLEVTRDISMSSVSEDSQPSLECSGQDMEKIQTSAEDALVTHPANVTHDISSSSDMSVQYAASDMQCNTSSKNATSELPGEPVVALNNVEGHDEELLTSSDAQLTGKVPEPSPKPESVNNTFTIDEQSSLSASTNVKTSAQILCPQNRTLDLSSSHVNSSKAETASINLDTSGQLPGPQNRTLDLPPSNVNSPKADSDARDQVKICPQNTTLDLPPSNVGSPKVETDSLDQATSVSKSTTETSSNISQNCSALKSSASCDVQNVTFDRHSLRKPTGSTVLGEAAATTFNLQNNTFDTKTPSKQNGTITVSETSSSRDNTLDMKSPSKQNGTITVSETSSSRDNTLDMKSPSKQNGTITVSETSSSGNNTLDMKSPSKQNGTITVSETSSSGNNTLDMKSPSKQNGTITVSETSSSKNNTFDTKSPLKQNGTITVSETSSSGNNTLDMKSPSRQTGTIMVSETSSSGNNTVDMKSPSKQNGTITVSETSSSKNNTFDTKSPLKQNGTITVSETSSSDSHQSSLDKPSPKVCNATSSSKDSNSEVHPPEPSKQNGTTSSEDPDAKMADTPESMSEASPTVEVASEAGRHETKDNSHLGPMRDRLSDMFAHQSIDAEDNKANTLNLDDTLELRSDSLVTSTPMPNCKMFNFHVEREEGKIIGAQKKLYGDGPSKPDGQVSSDVPSNIVCDRKTFLTQPAVKSLLPPLKPPSKLLKFKPASTLPGKFDPLMSGLPMTRQRTQAEALRNTAASDASQATTGISTSYNLRATTAASKLPNPGLRKPALSGIPSGIQRAAPSLRPPSTRSNAPASSSTDKPRGPTATSPATKSSQAKKHPLTRGEALPTAKRKKMDAPVPSGNSEASTSSDATNQPKNLKRPAISQRALPAKIQRDDAAVPASTAETSTSCNAVTRGRTLKPPVTNQRALLPKPQGHGCAKCHVLEQQLEMKSEEIRRLKEELLKYKKQEEES